MKATLKKETGLSREFEVEIPAATFTNRKDAELKRIGQKVKIEGFRAGKVPAQVLKKRYGANATAEVLDKLIQESYALAITQNKIRPASEPKIHGIDKFEEGQDLKYNFTVEVFPEVPDLDYSKIKLEKLISEVEAKEVSDALERIAGSNKSFAKIEKSRAAKAGDLVVFDFTGRKDGVAFEGGTSTNFRLELGSGQFIPGFEEQMIGMNEAQEKTFPITFPKEYHSKDLAGAKTEFTVKINEIHEAGKPKIDDELAKKLGLENVADLEKAIKESLGKELEEVSKMKLRKELFDQVDAATKFEVPESMVERDFKQIMQQMKAETPNVAEKELEIEARTLAERRVRLGILLSEIGAKNKIQPTEQELRQAIFAKAQSMPQQAQQIFEFYQKNPQAQEMLQGEILEDKVVDFIISKVEVKDKKVSREELMHDEDSDHGHVHDENCGHSHEAKPKKVAAAKKSPTKKKA